MADPTCLDEGMLSGTHLVMPSEPGMHWTVRDAPVPCSRIRCRACGEWVRAIEGFALKNLLGNVTEWEALFATTDPASSPFLTKAGSGAHSRTYACKCDAYSVGGNKTLKYGGPDDWTCGGHPQG